MKKVLITICVVILFIMVSPTFAQSLEGMSGLFFIPTADMPEDGSVTMGANFLYKDIVSHRKFTDNAYSPFITFNYLPFLQLSLRITRDIGYNGNYEAIGDRTPSLRLRIFKEKENTPAVVFGFHDLMSVFGGDSAVFNNALYLVSSKHFSFKSVLNSLGIHLGYGVDWIHAYHHNFVGLFGGIDLTFFDTIQLMSEYDSKYFNGGIRLKLINHISILGGFLRYKYFSGGAGVSFKL